MTVRQATGELESVRVRASELVARVHFVGGIPDRVADRHTRDLVRVLGGLDVDEVKLAEGESVTGTRSADPGALIGVVLVTGVLLKPVLKAVVSLVGAWLEQSGQRSVTVELGGAKVTVKGRVAPEHVESYVRALRETPDQAMGHLAKDSE